MRFFLLLNKPKGVLYFEADPFNQEHLSTLLTEPVYKTTDEKEKERTVKTIKPLGFIDFANVISIDDKENEKTVILIKTHTRIYYLKCRNEIECSEWIIALRETFEAFKIEPNQLSTFDDDLFENFELDEEVFEKVSTEHEEVFEKGSN